MDDNEANLTEYELERKRKIARNQALIAQLDLKSLANKVAPEKPKRNVNNTTGGGDGHKRGPKGAHARKRMKPQRFSSRADKLKKQQRLTHWKGQRIGSLRTNVANVANAVVTTEVIALGRLDPKEKDGEEDGDEGNTNVVSGASTSNVNDRPYQESMQTSDYLSRKSHVKNPPVRKRGRPRLDEMDNWGAEQKPPAYVMAEKSLIPRRYLAEGECFDEPYYAWVDEHKKHHLIWGRDDTSKSQKSVQTIEEGVDTPSEAAVLILEELQRREFEKWESEREENLKTAIVQRFAYMDDILTEPYYPYGRDALPSRYKKFKPGWREQQQQRQKNSTSNAHNHVKVSEIYANPFSEEARKMKLKEDLSQSGTTEIKSSGYNHGGVLQCSTCGKSCKDTPKMRAGQFESIQHLCTACGLFYATFGRKRPLDIKKFEELPINIQNEKRAAFSKLEEEARRKAIEENTKAAAENAPPSDATAQAPVLASANEEAKPKLLFTMKSPAVEGKSAWPQTLLNENDNNNSNSINCVAEGQKKEFKAELAETKVTEEDAVKVMLKFSADNLIKLELITGSLEKQQQLHQVNETNVKDATNTVVEHAKPSLKIVMHRPHAAPDSTTEGRKKEDGGEDPSMGIEVKQEVMVKEEETKKQGTNSAVVTHDFKTAKYVGLNHCGELSEQIQKAIPEMGEMTKLVTFVGAGMMTKSMVEEGIFPDEDAISQIQPWIAQLNPTRLPARFLVNPKIQILPPEWSNPDVGSDALMFAANIAHRSPIVINPIKLRKYKPDDIDGDMIFGYGQLHVQDSLLAFRERDEEWQSSVPAPNENNNEMDEDTQDDLDAIRDYKETLERESGYEEDCDQQMYIQGVNKAISSVKKARLKEFRDTKRIQERNRRSKEYEDEKKRLRMQMTLQPIRFMTPREREKLRREKQLKIDEKNGKSPSTLGKSLAVTMKKPAEVSGRAYTPEEIPIICGKLTGMMMTNGRPRLNLMCRIDGSDQLVGPTEFEKRGGSKKKKWKNSIYVRFENGNDDSTGMTLGHHMIESGKDFDNDGRIRNKKVAVYRPSDGGFHIGTITKFLENSGEHRVEYDDGKAEELYLFLMDLKWEPEIVDEKTNGTDAMNEEAKEAEGEEKEEEEEKEEDKEKEEKEEDFENLSDLELVYKIGKPAGAPGKSGAKHPISLGPFEVYTIDNFGISKHHPMRMSERRKCLEILNIVRSTEGRGKGIGKAAASSTRLLVEMFERLPMKSQLPEYYKIIRYPIDVATIEISLKSGVYASPWWFFVAMELVFANAQRYNDPATQMYADAAVLRECMHSAAKDLFGSDVPFPVAGGDIYDDVEEPTEYKETRIIPYEINDEANPFAGDDIVYRDHREIISETSGLYHPPAQVTPKVIREEIEREKAAVEEYGYEAVDEQEPEPIVGRGRMKIRYENKPMEIASLKRGPYKKPRRSKESIKEISSDEEMDYISDSDNSGGTKRSRPLRTRSNDTLVVAISLLERHSQLGTDEFMEKIEARGGGAGKEWARAGRKVAAFTAYMRNKSDVFAEITSAGGAIWSLAQGFSAEKLRDKIEPRHLPDRAAKRQCSTGAEGDEDEDEDNGRDAKVSKKATIETTNADGGSAWEWKSADGHMTQKATAVCHSVLRALRSAVEPETKRLRSELFELLPTSRVLPEYYRAIANPIDLRSITKCLRENGYATIWAFLVAVELCFSNAQSFNEEDSQIYEDAEELRKVGNETVRQLVPGHPIPVRDSCYEKESLIEPPWEKVKPKLTFTMKQKDDESIEALISLPPNGECGKCSVCMKNSSSKSKGAIKKCITSRMIQVARDTKLDLALLAAKGQDAVGVKIEIFWPGEDAWFSAVIKSFDELTCEHLCEYTEDNVEEKLALWNDSNWEEGTKIRIP